MEKGVSQPAVTRMGRQSWRGRRFWSGRKIGNLAEGFEGSLALGHLRAAALRQALHLIGEGEAGLFGFFLVFGERKDILMGVFLGFAFFPFGGGGGVGTGEEGISYIAPCETGA